MRFHLSSVARAKRASKSLQKQLSANGVETSLPACQNVVAEMYGYAHWRELEANVGTQPPSPDDENVDVAEVEARWRRQTMLIERHFPTLKSKASDIIRAVGATTGGRTVGSGPLRTGNEFSRFEDNRYLVHAFERDGMAVVGIADVDFSPPAVDYIAVEQASGAIKMFHLWESGARSIEDIEAKFAAAKPHCPDEQAVLAQLGYIKDFGWKAKAYDVRARDAFEADNHLGKVRDHLEQYLDREAFGICVNSIDNHYWLLPTYAFFSERGSMRARRHAFAKSWPDFVYTLMEGETHGPFTSLIDVHDDPDEAMIAYILRETDVERHGAKRILDRLRPFRWSLFREKGGTEFAFLGALPDGRIPKTQADADALDELACWTDVDWGFEGSRRRTELLVGAIMSEPGNLDTVLRRASQKAEQAVKRLKKRRIYLDGREPGDSSEEAAQHWHPMRRQIEELFWSASRLPTYFADHVMMPIWSASNELVWQSIRATPEGQRPASEEPPFDGDEVVDVCSELFFEGANLDDLIALAEARLSLGSKEWRLIDDKDFNEKPPTARQSAKMLDLYRPLFRPQYRDLTVGGLVESISRRVPLSARADEQETSPVP